MTVSAQAIAFALALGGLLAGADAIELPESVRITHRRGFCTWNCLEVAGRANGESRLSGLLGKRVAANPQATSDTGETAKVRAQLAALKVRCLIDDDGRFDYATLLQHADRRGVIVTMRAGTLWCGGKNRLKVAHSILITEFDDQQVAFYCPDNPTEGGKPKIWRASKEWFQGASGGGWSGAAVVILKGQE